ncbi:MAG: 3-phosphoglycerate dehydrogenase, partial [Planctomycetota bacterium]
MGRPVVAITEPLDEDAAAWLADRCEVVLAPCGDDGALGAALERADALIVRTYTRVDAALLARAPRLRVVGRAGVGLDNIDLRACRTRGVEVVHTPGANTAAVVEFVWSAVFASVRPIDPLERALPADAWRARRDTGLAPRELAGLTLGVLGLGRIGSAVARVGGTLMGRVIYHDLREIPATQRAGAEAVSRDGLLAESDILTVHVDGRASNRGLIGAGACARLRPEVIFINTSRGFVVDRPALAAFLRANPEARALLDVHDPEPIPPGDPLWGLPNARLTAHVAAATVPAKRAMSRVVERVW